MPQITLDFINEAADAKYGPFVVEGIPGGDVVLLNPLRMSKDKRAKLNDLQNSQGGDDIEAALDNLREMVRTVAKTRGEADRLLKALGDDQAKLAVVLEEYGKASRVGEASPSPS